MIILKQDTRLDRQKLESLLNKYGHVEYTFNSQLIQDDIDKIDSWIAEAKTSLRLENLKKIKCYLNGLLKKSYKKVEVSWVLMNNAIVSLPVEIRKLRLFNIQATDYMVSTNDSIIALDYIEVLNIIATELAYRDLDFTNEFIENELKDIGLITIYDSKVLQNIIDDRAYDKVMVMRIGDTAYMAPNRKEIYTYFGDSLEYDGAYRKVLTESCNTAISIIVMNLLSKINSMGADVKVYAVFEDSVYFSVPDGRNADIEQVLTTPIVVRAFGRKFEVKPKVQIY